MCFLFSNSINEIVEKNSKELIKAVQDMVKIKSVRDIPKKGMPFGEGVCKALNKQLEIAEKHMDLRYPCTKTDEGIVETFLSKLQGFDVENVENAKPLYVSKESKLIKTVTEVYSEFYDGDSSATAIGGGTYAKHLDNIVAFGPCIPGEELVEHTNHEHIKIDSLITLAKIYGNALELLLK